MKMQRTPGGLVIPKQPPEPKKNLLPLEFSDASHITEASKCFSTLLNMSGVRGGSICLDGDRQIARGRKLAILALAHQLLGEDWGYEELC